MISFKKLNNLSGWLVWVIATIVYCITIERTASFWDCGEYIACAYRLEVGHPPGAPFFMLMGRVFTLFGGTDPAKAALMINIMSAFASSFAILFLFWTITRLATKVYGKKAGDLSLSYQIAIIGAGVVGSLACTFSDTFWFNAVEGEVYASSSFFTALVFWAILKWDEEDSIDPTSALRWLILISFLIGVSIGVHLLSLLTIPAICFIIYFKKYSFSRKGFFVAGFSSLFVLVFVQNFLIPKIVKFVSDYEVFFTNKFNFGFSSGTFIYFLLLIIALSFLILYTYNKKEKNYKIGFYSVIIFSGLAIIAAPNSSGMFTRLIMLGGILYAIHKFKTRTVTLHAIFLSFATLLIGYSSFFILVIRSQANTPMDENDVENAPNMVSYLLREQYGEAPLLYGHYYNAPALSKNEYGNGDPVYAKDKLHNNYKIVDSRKNFIPKYEKDFCTIFPRMYSSVQSSHVAGYKYWGNVGQNHKTKTIENRNGEPETVEIPTMTSNLIYFLSYQVNYMYLRYFYWNFVGRQNDVQGMTGNNMEGNWITGIKAIDDMKLDTDTSKVIHRDKNNFANNHFYALPFILGLLGMIFHFRRKKQDAWIVLCLFLVTGMAIIIYLNQSPYQVRERDYAYVGSFYAFTIWIGFGVLYLHDLFIKKIKAAKLVFASTLLCLVVPGIMAKEGWNDHNRALRSLSRDSAIDYLQSCAPNAILFTNGDNDTFPLWYAQEVENIRTDVRVICLSLLNTDWYIKQARRAAYLSKPVPFTISEDKLEANKLEAAWIDARNSTPVNLKDALTYVTSDDPTTKIDNGREVLDILPSKNFYLNIDTEAVIKNKVVNTEDTQRVEKKITWDLGNRNFIMKSDLMVLDLIANNNWERPIYFTSQADETCVGLRKYLQLEGLTYRFVPIKQNEMEEAQGGRVNTDIMYNNVMTKYLWGGMDMKGVNLDENCLRSASFLRMNMGVLAAALINKGETKKAKEILDKCLQKMPDENVPFDMSIYNICAGYFQLGETGKANKLSKQLFDIYEGDLKVYNSQNSKRRLAYAREIEQAKWVLKNITGLSQQFRQEALSKEFIARMYAIIPQEELQPETAKQPLLQ
ncbi:MAG: DUF2723 domain-containing protein [Bacteroidia bacterium]